MSHSKRPAVGLSGPLVRRLDLDNIAAVEKLCQAPLARLQEFALRTQAYYGTKLERKRLGGFRVIRPPHRDLKKIQRRILAHFSLRTTWPSFIHGGVPGKDILTNARCHMKKEMVANLDVKSFFPSTDINTVLLALMRLGISREPAELLAALMTCPDETGTRSLPQGAPTSPYMANHVLSMADQRFATFCKKRRLTYTRYIDDIAISADYDFRQFKDTFVQFIQDAGFAVSAEKMTFCGRNRPQIVTGLVVNDRLRPTRSFLRELADLIKDCYWPGRAGLEVIAAAEGVTIQRMKDRIVGRIRHVARYDRKEARRLAALKFKRTGAKCQ